MPQLDAVLAQVDSFFAKADAVADASKADAAPTLKQLEQELSEWRQVSYSNVRENNIKELQKKIAEMKARGDEAILGSSKTSAALAAADALFAKADAAATGRSDAGDINNPKSGYYIWACRYHVSWSRAQVRVYYAVAKSEGNALRQAEAALKKDRGFMSPDDNFILKGVTKQREVSDYTAKTYGGSAMGSDAYPK